MQDDEHSRWLGAAVWAAASGPGAREGVRQRIILGIVAAEVFGALVIESLTPRSHRDVLRLEVGGEVRVVFEVREPHAGEVGFPIGGAAKRMVILRRADHMHFMDNVEQLHEAVRTSPPWIP